MVWAPAPLILFQRADAVGHHGVGGLPAAAEGFDEKDRGDDALAVQADDDAVIAAEQIG